MQQIHHNAPTPWLIYVIVAPQCHCPSQRNLHVALPHRLALPMPSLADWNGEQLTQGVSWVLSFSLVSDIETNLNKNSSITCILAIWTLTLEEIESNPNNWIELGMRKASSSRHRPDIFGALFLFRERVGKSWTRVHVKPKQRTQNMQMTPTLHSGGWGFPSPSHFGASEVVAKASGWGTLAIWNAAQVKHRICTSVSKRVRFLPNRLQPRLQCVCFRPNACIVRMWEPSGRIYAIGLWILEKKERVHDKRPRELHGYRLCWHQPAQSCRKWQPIFAKSTFWAN